MLAVMPGNADAKTGLKRAQMARNAEERLMASGREAEFWKSIQESKVPQSYQDYMHRFPSGVYASIAQSRLRELQAATLYSKIGTFIQSDQWDEAAKATLELLKLNPKDEQGLLWQQQISRGKEANQAAQSRVVNIGMEFVRIPAGRFMMGCSQGDSDCDATEKPAHEVAITQDFEMQTTEVTGSQWLSIMGASSGGGYMGDNMPKREISWFDAHKFIDKLNTLKDGYRYRLPTEAEWEYAARGRSLEKYFGPIDLVAWYKGNSGNSPAHPVKEKQPNRYGLYDMLGGAYEWCEDWFGEAYYQVSPKIDPSGPGSGQKRATRGGSFAASSKEIRASARLAMIPDEHFGGFRCVRNPIPKKPAKMKE
jgi:formylglycine-generating enzyme